MTCWIFCNEQTTCDDEDNDEMKELLGVHYVSIGHIFRYCHRIQIAQTHKSMFPLVSVQVQHVEPGNMHP